jgi:hypothetical protein
MSSGFLSRITTGKRKRPRLTTLYGVHGIGKTTWASKWPKPLFITWEDGCADLDVAAFQPRDLADGWGILAELGSPEFDGDYSTVVIDSADWLEAEIQRNVVERRGKKSLDDFDFGKGYHEAAEVFSKLLRMLGAVRDGGMHVVVLAHCEVKGHSPPGQDSYDRYAPKLHKETSAMLQEWSDEVLFAGYETFVRKEDLGFKKERGVAVGGTNRVLHCQESAGYLAKNRLGLPAKMSFDFAEYETFLNQL